jgi:transposase
LSEQGVFLKEQEIPEIPFAKALISSIWSQTPKMHLILDRTNWKFGSQDINYLVLAVRVGKVVFPLFWTLLDHQGNSDTKARMDILNKFKEAFGLDKILSFSADREFIGKEWISYLLDHNISFFIRIKDNQLANDLDTKRPLKEFFHNLGTEETLKLPSIMDDPRLVIVGKKFKEENLVICSNVQDKDHVLRTYRQRWDIERLFRNMKTQGFNLENTQMKDLKRLSKLMAFIAIAILFSTITGLTQKCSYKKTVRSPLYSIFTKGLRWLKTKLLTFSFTKVFRLLQKSEG